MFCSRSVKIFSARRLSLFAVLSALGIIGIVASPAAAIFGLIEDTVEAVEEVEEIFDQVVQPNSEDVDSIEVIDAAPRTESVEAPTDKAGSGDLYPELAKRSNETHEEWWDRVEPTILYMPGEDYRAWKATLSDEDREAYDAVTRQRNYERTQQFEDLAPLIIEDVLRGNETERHNSCNYVEDSSASCQQR